ncbi:hypothetical protein [Nocardia sp. NPDC051570]|uniref:hypothetical protein n=1 Tax=Nocardia sp. NPDC051570 TaxID=3364324 RepID=UPI00378C5F3F
MVFVEVSDHLLRMAVLGHQAQPGRAQVGEAVVDIDLLALQRSPVALHRQFGGHTKGASEAQAVERGVDVAVDEIR